LTTGAVRTPFAPRVPKGTEDLPIAALGFARTNRPHIPSPDTVGRDEQPAASKQDPRANIIVKLLIVAGFFVIPPD